MREHDDAIREGKAAAGASRFLLSPSIHKFGDELINSGLNAERANARKNKKRIHRHICASKHLASIPPIRPRSATASSWGCFSRPCASRLDEIEKEKKLTSRERKIPEKMAEGKSNRMIAQELFLSEHTVKTHLGGLLKKTGIKRRYQLILYLAPQNQARDWKGGSLFP